MVPHDIYGPNRSAASTSLRALSETGEQPIKMYSILEEFMDSLIGMLFCYFEGVSYRLLMKTGP